MSATRAQKRKSDQKRRQGTIDQLAEKVQEAADLPEPPTHETLIRLLGVVAMSGHVPAIRLLLEEYRRNGDSDEGKTSLGEIVDELAQRRAVGA